MMYSVGLIEAPQPLLPPNKYPTEEQKPLWTIKKLSLARCGAGPKSQSKTHGNRSRVKTLASIYEEAEVSEKIPIKRVSRIVDPRFKERIIYESYKPNNLREMQDFMHFMLSFRRILPNYRNKDRVPESPVSAEEAKDGRPSLPCTFQRPRMTIEDVLLSAEVSQEIKNYYNAEVHTKLPEQLDQEKILLFDSNFECGNLDRVSIVSLNEYNLFLNPDTNTKGHSQWFYFAVTNTEKGRTVVFNILNCTKPIPLFKYGMRPLVYSEADNEENGTEWVPETHDAFYSKNNIPKNPPADPSVPITMEAAASMSTYYTLTFSHTFKHSGDRVYFAYSQPYSVSMHCAVLSEIQKSLLAEAKSAVLLEEDGLQKRIKKFVEEERKTTEVGKDTAGVEPKKARNLDCQEEEDQFKLNNKQEHKQGNKRKPPAPAAVPKQVPFPEASLATADVLKEYKEGEKGKKFDWVKGQDFQVETEKYIYRQETLCHTFSGFPVELITITAHGSKKHPIERRKVIFITARVHAAEVSGSFKVEGVLRFLTGNSPVAANLREIYIFKIVPMLNPEGVLCGNFRCSLTGTDLNRRWDSPDEVLNSQIYYLKNLLKKLSAEKKTIFAFCDLHGHSRKNGAFIYGCNKAANGGFCSWTKVRLLPRIIAKKTPLFSYRDCKFRVESDKQRTARVVVWKEFGVTNSFTLESSFFGYLRGDEVKPYAVEDYYRLGEALLHAFLEYHYVLKGLEKEMLVTKGWLKPSRLIELTGTPAADLLAKEIALEKQELQRLNRRSKVQNAMVARKEKARLRRTKFLRTQPSKNSVTPPKNSGREYQQSRAPGTSQAKRRPAEPQKGLDTTPKSSLKSTLDKRKSTDETSPYVSALKDVERVSSADGGEGELLRLDATSKISVVAKSKTREQGRAKAPGKALSSDRSDNAAEESPERADFSSNWREYFSVEEIENAYNKLNSGIDPNDAEEGNLGEVSGSDSNPSEDNLERDEMQDFIASLRQTEVEQSPVSNDEEDSDLDEAAAEEKKPVSNIIKPQTAGANKRPAVCTQPNPWTHNVEAPSIVITSKTATKAASLAREAQTAGYRRGPVYYTTKPAPATRTLEVELRKKRQIRPVIAKIQNLTATQKPIMAGMARGGTAAGRTSGSRNIYNDRTKSTPHTKPLPMIQRTSEDYSRQLKDSERNLEKLPGDESLAKGSANFKMVAEHTTCSPTININIRSVNINTPGFGEQYRSFYHQKGPSKRHTPRGVSRVLAAIPRHDESPVFQKLFATSNKYQQQEKTYEYYREKKRARIGATLTELLVGSMAPANIRDYVIAKRADNASFRMVSVEPGNRNPRELSPQRPRGVFSEL